MRNSPPCLPRKTTPMHCRLLEKLHAAHPADPAITRMLAGVLAQSGDAAGSDKLYLALLAKSPDDVDLLVAHGQNLIRQQRFPEALAAFDKATKLDSADADAWSGIAFAASKLHSACARRPRSHRALEISSGGASNLLSLGHILRLIERPNGGHHVLSPLLDSSGGKFPDQEWQARQRLLVLERK